MNCYRCLSSGKELILSEVSHLGERYLCLPCADGLQLDRLRKRGHLVLSVEQYRRLKLDPGKWKTRIANGRATVSCSKE